MQYIVDAHKSANLVCGLTELNQQPLWRSVLLLSVKYCFLSTSFVRDENIQLGNSESIWCLHMYL